MLSGIVEPDLISSLIAAQPPLAFDFLDYYVELPLIGISSKTRAEEWSLVMVERLKVLSSMVIDRIEINDARSSNP